ncbi:MAG: ferrous iron transport protein A [Sporomusaceae bacterium]|jgi:ferrous iron transport protein A|nr:ferrous iron transport protein A [Sporomusaceae bacterium]
MQSDLTVSSLRELEVGGYGKIFAVELDGLLRRRLMDLGILPGTFIECVRKSPAGDPIAFKVRNTVIALRSADADLIKVI